jgi:radical SAM protein with 4Fe4S-binding SPASM domain
MRGKEEFKTADALKIIEEASLLGVKHIAFTGGEPLLRDDLLLLLDHTTRRGIQASINTNGSLITKQIAEELLKRRVFVYLSVDGVGKGHERFREDGSWRCLLKTIEILNEVKIEFATVTTLNKGSYKNIEKIMDFCASSGSLFSCFLPLMPFDGGGIEEELLLSPFEVHEAIRKIDEEARRLKYRISLWCMPFSRRFIRKSRWVRIGGCRNREVLDIGVDGSLLLCDVLDISLSTLRGKSLREAVAEFESNKLNQEVSFPELPEECRECEVKAMCLGGCYARAYKKFGKLNEKDPLCPV